MNHVRWGVLGLLLATGCQPIPGIDSQKPLPDLTDGSSIISNNTGGLTGTLRIPDPTLISNNSSKLVNEGGAAFYKIQQLADDPLSGAEVALVDAWDKAISEETVKTNDSGRFSFSTVPSADKPYFVRASFTLNNLSFVFRSMVTTSEASADVDVASTLVAEKGRSQLQEGALSENLEASKLQTLVAKLRESLTPSLIPYMAGTSEDLLSTFEQLVLDDPRLRELAASLAQAFVKSVRPWGVETLISSEELAAKGAIPAEADALSKYGPFDVDQHGNLYFPRPNQQGDAISISKVTPAGEVSDFAQLPSEISAPVFMAFSPAGTLFVAGTDATAQKLRAFSGTGRLDPEPGYLAIVPGGSLASAPGRIVVDASESVYLANPYQHVIMKLEKGANAPQVLAGNSGESGYMDAAGPAARFNHPMSLALGKDGALYVADRNNACVRRVSPEGEVTTYAGGPGEQYRNGRGAYARFGSPQSIAVDARGTIYVTDVFTPRLRRISPFGSVFLVAGSGEAAMTDGWGQEAAFNQPRYLKFDGAESLYVRDRDATTGKEWIRRIRRQVN